MNNDEKIVKQFASKKGNTVIFRYPTMDDIDVLTEYINELSQEDTYITFSGEIITREAEEEYLKTSLKEISESDKVIVVTTINNRVAGIADVTRDKKGKRRTHHIGIFGISLRTQYRGEGIGEELMKTAIDEAKKKIPDLKIITLGVYGVNDKAINLYKKIGFKEHGRLPKGCWYRGDYLDHVEMYLEV